MRSLIRPYTNLSPAIYAISFAKVVSALGAFVGPFLTLTLNVHLGLDPLAIGWSIAIVSLFGILGSLVGGWLSDEYQHRTMMLTGMFLSALSYGVGGFFVDSLWLVAFLAFGGFGSGVGYPAGSALIAELTHREQRKAAIGLSYMGTNIGFALGPLLASLFFHTHPAWLFWGDGLTTIFALIIVAVGTKDAKPIQILDEAHPEAAVSGSVWQVLWSRPKLIVYALGSMLLSMCYAQVGFTLPLALTEFIGKKGTGFYGWTMMVNGLFAMLWTPIIIRVMTTNAFRGLAFAGLTLALGFGSYYFILDVIALSPSSDSIAVLMFILFSTVIWTAGEVLTVTIGGVFVANESPESHRGRINGLLPLVYQITNAGTPVIMGALLKSFTLQNIWIIVAGFASMSCCVFFISDFRWPDSSAKPLPAD